MKDKIRAVIVVEYGFLPTMPDNTQKMQHNQKLYAQLTDGSQRNYVYVNRRIGDDVVGVGQSTA